MNLNLLKSLQGAGLATKYKGKYIEEEGKKLPEGKRGNRFTSVTADASLLPGVLYLAEIKKKEKYLQERKY